MEKIDLMPAIVSSVAAVVGFPTMAVKFVRGMGKRITALEAKVDEKNEAINENVRQIAQLQTDLFGLKLRIESLESQLDAAKAKSDQDADLIDRLTKERDTAIKEAEADRERLHELQAR